MHNKNSENTKRLFSKILNKETGSYIFFGVLTTIINFSVYFVLVWFGWNYKKANLVAIIISKLAAYITNKLFVFQSKTHKLKDFLKEFLLFMLARSFSGLLDYFMLILMVHVFLWNSTVSKIITQIMIIIINYFLGKFLVFKKKAAAVHG